MNEKDIHDMECQVADILLSYGLSGVKIDMVISFLHKTSKITEQEAHNISEIINLLKDM